ncbi:MAG: alpha/beta hydrolase [Hyphomicrobiaceae bacterium]
MSDWTPLVISGAIFVAAAILVLLLMRLTARLREGARRLIRIAMTVALVFGAGALTYALLVTPSQLGGVMKRMGPPPATQDEAAPGSAREPPPARRAFRKADRPADLAPAPKGGSVPAKPVVPPSPRRSTPEEKAAEPDYHSVPVFFGTDRKRDEAAGAKRISFGSERARKLLLGQALVTVPRIHQVPQVERPWSIRIPFTNITIYEQAEDPKKHFTIQRIGVLSEEEFLRLVRARLASSSRNKDQALIFVHGYNTPFDAALYRAAQIAYDLRFDGAPFVYSWPSGGGLGSYTYDRDSSRQSEPFLKAFLELVVARSGAKSVNIIAHSMGNLPLLHVLSDLKKLAAARPDVTINQIILAAPDVDRDVFENLARQIQGVGRGITLYASSSDLAMRASRRFGGGVPRAGDVPEDGPVVVAGIDTIDITAVSTAWLALNHSGYAESKALINDIGLLLRTGERPPEKRIPILERIERRGAWYWRYPQPK